MDKVEELLARVSELRKKNIGHVELGIANDFREAEVGKSQLLAYLEKLLVQALAARAKISPAILITSLETIEKGLNAVNKNVENIEEAVAAGIHTPEFPRKRESFVQAAAKHFDQFQTALQFFETTLRVLRLEDAVTADASLDATRHDLQAALADVERGRAEIERAVTIVRDRMTGKTVEEVETGFSALARGHARREKSWFIAFVVAGVILCAVILWTAFAGVTVKSTADAIVLVFRRLLLVSAAAVFLRLALGKYNAERNLKIIYDHRGAGLSQYSLFETAIGDDIEGRQARNQFRLELAKYIFTDPSTGYISTDAAADVNINPVISTVERLVPKP